jgi:hypothetical protein
VRIHFAPFYREIRHRHGGYERVRQQMNFAHVTGAYSEKSKTLRVVSIAPENGSVQ